MKRHSLILLMLLCGILAACGGSASEPVIVEPDVVQVQATVAPPTDVPTALPEPTETIIVVEPTAAVEAYDFYGDYRVPDVTKILATGRPQFINSYTDW